jgi:hypothetical protein
MCGAIEPSNQNQRIYRDDDNNNPKQVSRQIKSKRARHNLCLPSSELPTLGERAAPPFH